MQKVTDSFELPKDIVLGLPIVTAYGYNELTIENHKGILSFSDKAVTVNLLQKNYAHELMGECHFRK